MCIRDSPTVFRIDRISEIKDTGETFRPFKDRYEESEFRKCVQFMYSGELHRVTFLYKGENVDSVQMCIRDSPLTLSKSESEPMISAALGLAMIIILS